MPIYLRNKEYIIYLSLESARVYVRARARENGNFPT